MLHALRNLPAPAKVNLFLHVVGRRHDGYHLLQTVFQLIDLCDRVDLEQRSDGRIERHSGAAGVSADQDLVVRAARLLQSEANCSMGCTIALRKQIPMGGGLGGGSSDAATVLLGLNRLWGLHWPRFRLAALALRLGADVPVFVRGHNALAHGVGEKLRPVTLPADRWMVLVRPDCAVPTALAFQSPELRRDTPFVAETQFAGPSPEDVWQACMQGRNDLEQPVAKRYPAVEKALDGLRQAALSLKLPEEHARMSGSGSCVFLPTTSREAALAAAQQVRKASRTRESGRLWVVRALSRHPLL
jgi:4-diphosphocytidyl-2-C-methyl-D-erythritol kinase